LRRPGACAAPANPDHPAGGMKMKTIFVAALAALALSACGGELDPSDELAAALNLAPADTARVLDFVNYPGTDKALLDNAVGLDERAAQNIILKRNGADKVAPSADDQPFATLIALDAISYVTDTALQKLAAYSSLHPAPASQTVETVSFAGWEAEAVVYGVNHGAQVELAPML